MKKINDNQIPEITVESMWSWSDIQRLCIKNDWYTRGDARAYGEMLDFVDKHEPTAINIYKVAQDILKHSEESECLYIEAIMFEIANEVVETLYTVKRKEEHE